ncbi:peptidoglycan-binding protein [Streptomyces sp. NPDC003023]|uniref:peptidoglycan-binding domain-containing protein n=1 Tax=Streptomyces sp. NPDC003023 TaxID=3364675 RepID=UPI00368571B8
MWSHGPGPYEAVQDHRSGTHPPAAGPGPLPDAVAMHHEEEAAFYVAGPGAGDAEAERRARRRRAFAGIVVGAAAVAVAGTAALAGGLFAGDDTQDRALPPDTRSSAPSASVEPDAPSGSVSTGVSASASASPSASVSASPSSSPSPSRSAPRTSPSAGDAPAAPSAPPPSTARATGTVSEAPPQNNGGTLRRGDSGPAVTELQQRLRQLWLYPYDEADGRFDEDVEQAVKVYQWDRGIERDPLGVYGPHTRRALEAETRDP